MLVTCDTTEKYWLTVSLFVLFVKDSILYFKDSINYTGLTNPISHTNVLSDNSATNGITSKQKV